MERKRWTVGEITRYVRQMFETDIRLQDVEVEGEVSDFRIPSSGHAYFTLKDADASLACVMWRSDVQAQRSLPEHGDRVIAYGRFGVYEKQGQYQLYCKRIHPAGLGDLHAQFEALKERLQAEGLFDRERRPIPLHPRTIGVVTSPSTAALQDVLNVLRRRYPLARVILSETPVQGDRAAPQIQAALDAFNNVSEADKVDVILLVRGGGSLEDLWCFNDEALARAVAASRVPVISGVGHEIDFTLVDFTADQRAPTPSAAAELAASVTVDELRMGIHQMRARLATSAETRVAAYRREWEAAVRRIDLVSPRARIDGARQTLDVLSGRLAQAAGHRLALLRKQLDGTRRALAAVSPAATLARGYAVVRGPDGAVLRRAADAAPGDRLDIRLAEGRLSATVDRQDRNDE
jgi:exodeoxyribonuclease VII large subunit